MVKLMGAAWFLLAGLSACAQAQDDAGAAKTLQGIEDKLAKARSLKVSYVREGDVSGAVGKIHSKGVLLLKDGNKVKLDCREKIGNAEIPVVVISDGTRMKDGVHEKAAPASLKERFTKALARVGISPALAVVVRGVTDENGKETMADLDSLYPISKAKLGPEENGARTLEYTVGAYEAKLWYDPATLKLRKRTLTTGSGRLTETYEDLALDGEVPDTEFTLPAKK